MISKKIKTWIVPTISMLLVAVVIFWAGPYIAFAEYYPLAPFGYRLWLFSIIVIGVIGYQLWQHMKILRADKRLQHGLTESISGDDLNLTHEKEALDKNFKEALSNLSDNVSNSPLYMIIGDSGSGKTTLMAQVDIGLRSSNKDSTIGIEQGTSHCNWWSSDKGIFLDTAGRYTAQKDKSKRDEMGWKHLLNVLKKYRRKPLNGIIVTIAMNDLFKEDDTSLSRQLANIKERLTELNRNIGTSFPVYVVITKCDLLSGFNAIFDAYSARDREQLLGITFDPGQQDKTFLNNYLSNKLQSIREVLCSKRWEGPTERDGIKTLERLRFPQQLTALTPNLQSIINKLASDEHSQHILRGIYFTSSIQEGQSTDPLVASLTKTMGLSIHFPVSQLSQHENKTFFSKEIFTELIFKEAQSFGVNPDTERKKAWLNRAAALSIIVITGGLLTGWTSSYLSNHAFLSKSENQTIEWSNTDYSSDMSNKVMLAMLDELYAASFDSSAKESTHLSAITFNKYQPVQDAIKAVYKRLLTYSVLPLIKDKLEYTLKVSQDRNELYNTLEAYLLLHHKHKRTQETLNTWKAKISPAMVNLSPEDTHQLDKHLTQLIEQDIHLEKLDQSLIAASRQKLQHNSPARKLYTEFKEQQLTTYRWISMIDLAGYEWESLFQFSGNDQQVISAFYTPDVYAQVRTTGLLSFLESKKEEDWITGNSSSSLSINKELLRLYDDDYINQWNQVLKNIDVKQLSHVLELEKALSDLQYISSPLMELLERVAHFTDVLRLLDAVNVNTIPTGNSAATRQVKQVLNAGKSKIAQSKIPVAFQVFRRFSDAKYRQSLQDRLSPEFEILYRNVNAESSGNINAAPLRHLNIIAKQQGYPVRRWLEHITSYVKRRTVKQTQNQMIAEWKNQIEKTCQSATAKYPFNQTSRVDIGLSAFNNFLSYQGVLQQFFDQYLSEHVNQNVSPWQWSANSPVIAQLSPDVLTFYEQLSGIQTTLFANNAPTASFNFYFKPVRLSQSPPPKSFKLVLMENQIRYQYEKATKTTHHWPGNSGTQETSFTFDMMEGGATTARYEGNWAFFRMMEDATINQLSNNQYHVTFSKAPYKAQFIYSVPEDNLALIWKILGNLTCPSF